MGGRPTPYAGKKVELSISYVSDWGTQGIGVFVDDAKVTSGGATHSEHPVPRPTSAPGPSPARPRVRLRPANDWISPRRRFAEGGGVVTR